MRRRRARARCGDGGVRRATRDATEATTRANASRDAAESRAVADAESARRAAATANARAERAERQTSRASSSHEARLAATLAGDPKPGSPRELAAARAEHATRVRELKPRGPRDARSRATRRRRHERPRGRREGESARAEEPPRAPLTSQRHAGANRGGRARRASTHRASSTTALVSHRDEGDPSRGRTRGRTRGPCGVDRFAAWTSRARGFRGRVAARGTAARPATSTPRRRLRRPRPQRRGLVRGDDARARASERDARVVEPPRSARGSPRCARRFRARQSLASRPAARRVGFVREFASTADERIFRRDGPSRTTRRRLDARRRAVAWRRRREREGEDETRSTTVPERAEERPRRRGFRVRVSHGGGVRIRAQSEIRGRIREGKFFARAQGVARGGAAGALQSVNRRAGLKRAQRRRESDNLAGGESVAGSGVETPARGANARVRPPGPWRRRGATSTRRFGRISIDFGRRRGRALARATAGAGRGSRGEAAERRRAAPGEERADRGGGVSSVARPYSKRSWVSRAPGRIVARVETGSR